MIFVRRALQTGLLAARPAALPAEEFANFLKADFDMWLSVIKANGIRID